MAKVKRGCRSCVYLGAKREAAEDLRAIRKGKSYRCTAPMPPLPPMPDSVRLYYANKGMENPPRTHVQPDDGAACPTWAEWKPRQPAPF